MSMTSGSQGKASAEINVTPMIDVLLVLLIICLLVPPVTRLGERAEIPRPSGPIDPPDDPVVIQLHDAGEGKSPTLKINQQEVGWNELQSSLREIYKFRGAKTAFLRSDPEVEFQFVAEVIDISHFAGVEHVGLIPGKI
jgi:biopolymer transport protein TolR